MLIRPATFDDIPLLEKLIPDSVRRLSTGYYSPRQIESAIIHIFGVDRQLLADGTYFVADADGEIAGCGGWSKRKTLYGGDQWKEAEDPLLDPAGEAGRIRAFFVHPGWARQGIGRRLIERCEHEARAGGFKRLELAATLPGEPLYAALGYRSSGRLVIQLPDGETLPVVAMEKEL